MCIDMLHIMLVDHIIVCCIARMFNITSWQTDAK